MTGKRKASDSSSSEDEINDNGLELRLQRATQQKMLVAKRTVVNGLTQVFHLLGSTGNVYTVTIGKRLQCCCPDFEGRQKHCKHILMVLSKVFHLDVMSRAYRRIKLSSQLLEEIFANYKPDSSLMADDSVITALNNELEKEEEEEEESDSALEGESDSQCFGCYEMISKADLPSTLLCYVCNHNVHENCFDQFNTHETPNILPCPECRSDIDRTYDRNNEEKYINLSKELGVSKRRVRPTKKKRPSTFFSSFSDDEDGKAFGGRLAKARSEKMVIARRVTVNDWEQTFDVVGSTGNVYKVTIAETLHCTCPDYNESHCKHILMILLKAFHLATSTSAFKKIQVTRDVLTIIFQSYHPDSDAMANDNVKNALVVKEHEREIEEEMSLDENETGLQCSCCQEIIAKEEFSSTLHCHTCQKPVHDSCLEMNYEDFTYHPTKCPKCWKKVDVERMRKEPEYLNLGAVAGISTKRQGYKKRSRGYYY